MTAGAESPPLWTLQQLSQKAGEEIRLRGLPSPGNRVSQVPNARTIRYYTSLGLVDRPVDHAGRVARYSQRHLLQLLAIKALQSRYLPLPQIQARLLGRSDEELARIVDLVVPPAQTTPAVDIAPALKGAPIAGATQATAAPSGTEGRPPAQPPPTRWKGQEVGPGLVLLIQDAAAARDWLRNHTPEEQARAIRGALGELL